MPVVTDDVGAMKVARFGVARFGTTRFGFTPRDRQEVDTANTDWYRHQEALQEHVSDVTHTEVVEP